MVSWLNFNFLGITNELPTNTRAMKDEYEKKMLVYEI